jgi:hypothetical protein
MYSMCGSGMFSDSVLNPRPNIGILGGSATLHGYSKERALEKHGFKVQ